MKLNLAHNKYRAITAFEVLVIVACLLIFAAMFLAILVPKRHVSRISCMSNLRQVGLSFMIWAGDNDDRYPMTVSVTNGGAMELMETGSLVKCLQCVSNEMTTPKIFVCPDDSARTFATNWNDLNSSHVSYFLSADAGNDTNLETIFSGDDNLAIGGMPLASGVFDLSSKSPVEWAPGRHTTSFRPDFWSLPRTIYYGNLSFADGHVEQFGLLQLQDQLRHMEPVTNRIVIP